MAWCCWTEASAFLLRYGQPLLMSSGTENVHRGTLWFTLRSTGWSSLHSRRNAGHVGFLALMNRTIKWIEMVFFLFQGNIFLRSADLSFNGLGKEGAVALGQALRENQVLEELNVRYGWTGLDLLASSLQTNGDFLQKILCNNTFACLIC